METVSLDYVSRGRVGAIDSPLLCPDLFLRGRNWRLDSETLSLTFFIV